MANYTSISATTAAVANRFVTSVAMANGAYTLANTTPVWQGGCFVTVTHTEVGGGVDTLGTITIVGKDLSGATRTDVITPLNGTVATGTVVFRTLISATQAGWVIGTGNDTIVIGCAAGSIAASGHGKLYGIHVNATAAATVVISDSARTIATLAASIANGTYLDSEDGIDFAGFLKVATTSTNDITVIHSATLPASYAI